MISNFKRLPFGILPICILLVGCGISPIRKNKLQLKEIDDLEMPYSLEVTTHFRDYRVFMSHIEKELTEQAAEELLNMTFGARVPSENLSIVHIELNFKLKEHRLTWQWEGELELKVRDKRTNGEKFSGSASAQYLFTEFEPEINEDSKYVVVYNVLSQCFESVLPDLKEYLKQQKMIYQAQIEKAFPSVIIIERN